MGTEYFSRSLFRRQHTQKKRNFAESDMQKMPARQGKLLNPLKRALPVRHRATGEDVQLCRLWRGFIPDFDLVNGGCCKFLKRGGRREGKREEGRGLENYEFLVPQHPPPLLFLFFFFYGGTNLASYLALKVESSRPSEPRFVVVRGEV